MKKIILCFLVSGILFSCKQPAPPVDIKQAPVDSLVKNWSDAWNNHDSVAVRNLFLPTALLIDDNLVAQTADEIAAKWIGPNIRLLKNFKAVSLQQWSVADRAAYTGKYEFEVVMNDSVVAKPTGAFTINWLKSENGEWKITTAVIHSFTKKN
jgi:ketosteroid isomerase-like protein